MIISEHKRIYPNVCLPRFIGHLNLEDNSMFVDLTGTNSSYRAAYREDYKKVIEEELGHLIVSEDEQLTRTNK